ncbi:MAG: sulfurtransferase TusA family protein [Alphaproteobacteria bacterium]
MSATKHTAELDARGLKCPLPVLRARRAMKPLATGDVLLMLATDLAAAQDVPAFCETTGHVLKKHDSTELEGEAVLRFWIEKS